jgi:predicted lipoprotein with Yx(FWY)xxD motif
MKRLLLPTVAAAAGIMLAACGSSTATKTASSGGTTPGGTQPVSVKQVDGVGSCTSFWTSAGAGAGSPTPMQGVTTLGVVDRPDGTKQLTDNGKPLYTFKEDSPGNVKGDNFSDDFGGQHFTWHVVRTQPTPTAPSGPTVGGGGSTGGSSGSGY